MKINFECTTSCNANCVFCPHGVMKRPRGQMTDELFHKIIKDGKDMGVFDFSPFFMGEPFLFPKIWEWLDYMEKEGVTAAMYTNGEFIDVERLVKYKNVRYLDFSINATTKETHQKVMRGPNFDKVVENYFKARKTAHFMVRASMVICEENQHEVKDFKKMFHRIKLCGEANWTGDIHSRVERHAPTRKACYPLLCQMMVLWDGKVVPCCMDYEGKMVLGDANKQTLREIWNSYKWMRNKHRSLDFDIPVCKDCNYNVEDDWI